MRSLTYLALFLACISIMMNICLCIILLNPVDILITTEELRTETITEQTITDDPIFYID